MLDSQERGLDSRPYRILRFRLLPRLPTSAQTPTVVSTLTTGSLLVGVLDAARDDACRRRCCRSPDADATRADCGDDTRRIALAR